MTRIEKTVFISYRRTDVYTALAVYENLKNQGYDVFFDYRSISSGDFEQIITSNIRARAHFLLILTPTALDRCNEPGDWLRREIEIAIDEKRNIVPLFFKGFRFGNPSISEKLTGKLKNLSRYNGLNVHEDYFDEAMHRLRTQYLNIPLETLLHPVSTEVQKVVREEQVAADKALEQIEAVKELVKQMDEPTDQPKAKLKSRRKKSVPVVDIPLPGEEIVVTTDTASQNTDAKPKRTPRVKPPESVVPREEVAETPTPGSRFNFRLIGGVAGGLLIISLLVWGGASLLRNMLAAPEPTATRTPPPAGTNTPAPTQIAASPIPVLSIGSTMISDKDGMTLLYVPAGEFMMGSDNGGADEKPVHTVYLDAFWIDRTEVTYAMYAKCVQDGACNQPSSTKSDTRDSYYGNSEFDNYPVIYVSWKGAKAYCEWADRRLPTEAEWEKAARGENAFIYPWGNDAPNNNLLNYNGAVGDTTEVGKYQDGASPYGRWIWQAMFGNG
jgi:formylglycine-generating enzyme required for sulfatase activity